MSQCFSNSQHSSLVVIRAHYSCVLPQVLVRYTNIFCCSLNELYHMYLVPIYQLSLELRDSVCCRIASAVPECVLTVSFLATYSCEYHVCSLLRSITKSSNASIAPRVPSLYAIWIPAVYANITSRPCGIGLFLKRSTQRNRVSLVGAY